MKLLDTFHRLESPVRVIESDEPQLYFIFIYICIKDSRNLLFTRRPQSSLFRSTRKNPLRLSHTSVNSSMQTHLTSCPSPTAAAPSLHLQLCSSPSHKQAVRGPGRREQKGREGGQMASAFLL